jgi:hypothetical protein
MTILNLVRNIILTEASSSTAATILNHVAIRKRRRKAETVRRMMKVCGNGTSRGGVVAVFRQLESMGFGKVIVGRRGHESRFEWAEV